MNYYCSEDPLSAEILLRLIRGERLDPNSQELIELQAERGGNSYIRAKFANYCQLSMRGNVYILTDLDNSPCAPSLRSEWLTGAHISPPLPQGMVFSIAEKEVESWLLADEDNFSRYLGISRIHISRATRAPDAKQALLDAVRSHGSILAKSEILPRQGVATRVGIGYNSFLIDFTRNHWNYLNAALNNRSLARAVQRIRNAP